MLLAQLQGKIPRKKIIVVSHQLCAGLTNDFSKADSDSQPWWLFSQLAQNQLPRQGQKSGSREDNDSEHSFLPQSAHSTLPNCG